MKEIIREIVLPLSGAFVVALAGIGLGLFIQSFAWPSDGPVPPYYKTFTERPGQ